MTDKHPISRGQDDEFTVCWREHRPGYVCLLPEGHDVHRPDVADAVRAAEEALTLIPGTSVRYPGSVARTVVAAVEPLIRAQAFADAAAVLARTRDQWVATRGSHDWSFRAEWAYREAARVLAAWAEDPTVIDSTFAKIAAEREKS